MVVDAAPRDASAMETFRLGTVGVAAGRIVELCLMRRVKLGSEGLGETGRVEANLMRSDTRMLGLAGSSDKVHAFNLGVLGELVIVRFRDGTTNGTMNRTSEGENIVEAA